jgi:hypothetical protein
MKIQVPNYASNPTEVDQSFIPCDDCEFLIDAVTPVEANGDVSAYVKFTLEVLDHDDENMLGRKFDTTFWEPDPSKGTKLQLEAGIARWKQLCLATEVSPEGDELDPHDFQGTKFRGQLYTKAAKKDPTGPKYPQLGDIHFSE